MKKVHLHAGASLLACLSLNDTKHRNWSLFAWLMRFPLQGSTSCDIFVIHARLAIALELLD